MKKKLAAVVAILLALAMTLPAYGAAAFVPSIGQKTSPQVIQKRNKNGKLVDFLIYDKDGNEIVPGDWSENGKELNVDGHSYILVVTGYVDKDKASAFPAIKEALEKAYAEIQGAKTLDKLSADVVKYLPSGMKLEDLAISDLFNVALLKDGSELVGFDAIGAASIAVEFSSKDVIMALLAGDNGWTVENVSGSNVTIKLSKPGVVAFVAKNTQGGGSPKTGYTTNTGVFAAIALVSGIAAVAGVCYITSKKRAK